VSQNDCNRISDLDRAQAWQTGITDAGYSMRQIEGERGFKNSARRKTKSAFGGVLNIKDREKVMENVATHEDWKVCFR